MALRLRRSLFLPVLFIALSLSAFSQIIDNEASHAEGGACGTMVMGQLDPNALLETTAREHPELYRRMMADSKREAPSTQAVSAADSWDFYVSNRVTGVYDAVK